MAKVLTGKNAIITVNGVQVTSTANFTLNEVSYIDKLWQILEQKRNMSLGFNFETPVVEPTLRNGLYILKEEIREYA